MTDAERVEVLQQRVTDLEALVAALRAQLAQRPATPLRPARPGRAPYEPWVQPWACPPERVRFGSHVFTIPAGDIVEVSL